MSLGFQIKSFPSQQRQRAAALLRPTAAKLLYGLLCGLLVACGGVQFERAAGVQKYRALPMGSPVTAQETIDGLSTPVVVVGVLKIDTKSKTETPDAAEGTRVLKKHAARFGCDAIVGAAAKSTAKLFKSKKKSLGADGRPVYEVVTTTTWTHHWTAQCVRTASAPKEVVMKRDKYGRLRPATATATASGAGKTTSGGSTAAASGSTKSNGKRTSTVTKATTAPKPAGTTTTTGSKTEAKPTAGPAPLPPLDAGDPKLASEVARAFLTFSRYAATANAPMLCKLLDSERVYFDIRTKEPAHVFKQDMTPAKACESLKSGKLAEYLRDFGPAEVHTEIPTLIPSLFRVHGGAFLKLDEARNQLYRTKVTTSRKGKTPLQCEMYSVLPAGNLFKVMLDCRGVRSYRLLLRRDGPNDFKLMALTHLR